MTGTPQIYAGADWLKDLAKSIVFEMQLIKSAVKSYAWSCIDESEKMDDIAGKYRGKLQDPR